MRVAHITTIDLSLRYLLLNQLQSIRAAGYEVTGISAAGPHVAAVEAAGVEHITAPLTRKFAPLADLRALWSLYRLLRQGRYDIVHTHTAKPGLLGVWAAWLAGVPVIVHTIHGYYFNEHTPRGVRRFYILLETLAARCADLLLSQGRAELALAVRAGICDPDAIKLLGNGIDLTRFSPECVTPDAVTRRRAEFKLPAGAPVVGFVGRLVAEKGLPELLVAACLVRQQIPDARFLLIGPADPDKTDALTPALAAQYGVEDCCVWAGMQEDMPSLYALMDVFVLPSHREGFPRSPMEASAMGVPAIVSDISGCRETVVDGENGLLFPVGDARALAAAIVQVLSDKEYAARLGQAGRLRARRYFDERKVFATVLAEYRRLLKSKN